MSVGGTIRCKHGSVMELVVQDNENVVVSTPSCHNCHVCYNQDAGRTSSFMKCILGIPKEVYDKIQRGCNFTHVFFKDEVELKTYLKDHADRFQFIGRFYSILKDERYHLIF